MGAKTLRFGNNESRPDGENPIPASLRKRFKKAKKVRIEALSSSDDDLPPSASQARPPKRGAKISADSEKTPQMTVNRSPKKHVRGDQGHQEESSGSDSNGDFVAAPAVKKRKRATTPPGQSKLSFSRAAVGSSHTSKETEKTSRAQPMSKIDAADFFNKFGKTDEEISKEKKQKFHKEKIESPKTHGTVETAVLKTGKKIGGHAGKGNKEDGRGLNIDACASEGSRRTPKKLDPEEDVPEKRSQLTPAKFDAGESLPEKHHAKKQLKHSPEKERKLHEAKGDERAIVEESPSKIEDKEVLSKEKEKKHHHKHKHHEDELGTDIKHREMKHATDTNRSTPVKESNKKSPSKGTRTTPEKVMKEAKRIEKLRSDTSSKVATLASHLVPPTLPWVDKYRPTSLKQLVGQNGEKSPMNKLLGWLRNWPKYHLGDAAKQKRPRPPPWMAQSDGSSFKAVLLSGPPGIGKTTCAVMACKELGLQFVEMNASDVRNKKFLEAKVAELIGCHQIDEYFVGKSKKVTKADELSHILIMDEVDGMSGTEDRAGLAELIQMIKETRIPIICICNDRQSPKMRSLINYCFDVRFQRPRVEQIRSRMQTIAFQEKLNLSKEQIDEVIEASNHDVRQTIYNLQLLSVSGKSADIQRKDCAVNTFEAARRILSADTSMMEKQEMFFSDYSIMPLFVQENYLALQNNKMNASQMCSAIAKAADSISQGDIIDKTIRTTGAWGLLNEQALFSSILPSMYMNGYLKSMINFPSWLGKNSTANKRERLMRQLASHTHLKISADRHSLVTDYVPVLRDRLCRPLVEKESDGVSEVIATYNEYSLMRDDSEAIAELAVWPGMEDLGSKIQTKVKSALTRALNKEHRLLPYAVDDVVKGRRRAPDGASLRVLDVELSVC
ncbi:Replication factor C subunit 1 [Toxocara canis]|uniref:Activator 1 large subunit n=1 Tax=Toxocara canis TaxID=6265 RepID=A0A0B2VRA9_TOXCA|nr:Replication factor C subunit 1 [Toxocara canis]